jgi:hypothetical protein
MRGLRHKSGRALTAFLCTVIGACAINIDAKAASNDTWGSARILYFEPFNTTIDARPTLLQKRTSTRQMKFDAYGRRFELTLEPNENLQSVSDANAHSTVNLYRGALANLDGSWARIATRGSAVHGLIWDGAELYVIEPSDAIRDSLVPPLDVANAHTVLFRLSDTILDAGAAFCASDPNQAATGTDAYASLAHELTAMKRGAVIMQSVGADRRLELSALADPQFRAQFGSDAEAIDQMLVRLNNVDGIFSAELGVQIEVPTTIVYDTTSDPLPATTSSTDLLRKLATFRAGQPQLRARGLTHLFTGRDLDGPTVGIGYVDSLCNKEFGVGLTEIRGRGVWLESLITTHEIGHNFGAVHDGEGQCSSTPINQFLMSPTVFSSNPTFSTCSRNRMNATLLRASCITSLPPADLSIASDLGIARANVGQAFEWDLPVINAGGRTARNARVEVRVPSDVSISDAWVAGGHCTSGAGVVECELDGIAGGATRSVHLSLNGSTAGSSEISAQIISASDAQAFNNRGSGTISIGALDLGIALQTSAASIATGTAFSASFVITNATVDTAQNILAQFDLPFGVSASAATVTNGSCTLQPLACTVPQLLPGALAKGTVTLVAQSAGGGTLSARVSHESPDPHTSNDSASVTIDVTSSTTTSAATSVAAVASPSSGGGGAVGLHLLVALLLLAIRRARLG